MAAKKIGWVGKLVSAFVAAPVAAGAGWGAGTMFKIDPGFKRTLIGLGLTAIAAGGAAIFNATRGMWWTIALGGTVGSLTLMGETAIKDWMARAKQKRAATPQPGQQQTISQPTQPAQPAQTVTIVAPTPQRKPTTLETLVPVFQTGLSSLGQVFGGAFSGSMAMKASGGTFGRLTNAAGGTFGRNRGSGGTYGRSQRGAGASSTFGRSLAYN